MVNSKSYLLTVYQANFTFLGKKITLIISPPGNDSLRKNLCFTANVLFFISPPASNSFRNGLTADVLKILSTRNPRDMRRPIGVKFCTVVSTRPFYNAGPKFPGADP